MDGKAFFHEENRDLPLPRAARNKPTEDLATISIALTRTVYLRFRFKRLAQPPCGSLGR
jgi:hypothetical protein